MVADLGKKGKQGGFQIFRLTLLGNKWC
jgi:hypothetical protein